MNRKIIEYKNSEVKRLDKYLSTSVSELSRTKIKKLIDDKYIKVNQLCVKSSYLLTTGDIISLEYQKPIVNTSSILPPCPQNLSLDLLYEDSSS